MANMNGNAAALARWRASQTPDQLRAVMCKAAKKRNVARMVRLTERAAQTGVAVGRSIGITVQLREGGGYVPGSSRSFSLDGCPHSPDEVRRALLELIPQVRQRLVKKLVNSTREVVKW